MSLLLCRRCLFAILLYRWQLYFKSKVCDFAAMQVQFFFVKNGILRCPHKLRRLSHLAMHYEKLPYFMIYWSISGFFILKQTTHYIFSIISQRVFQWTVTFSQFTGKIYGIIKISSGNIIQWKFIVSQGLYTIWYQFPDVMIFFRK